MPAPLVLGGLAAGAVGLGGAGMVGGAMTPGRAHFDVLADDVGATPEDPDACDPLEDGER